MAGYGDAKATQEAIRRLEEELLSPVTRGSRQRLEELLADDFMEFGSSGRILTREAVLEALPSEAPGSFTIVTFEARVLAVDLVLATYELESIRGGANAPVRSLRSSLWRQFGPGAWQVVFHQGTPIPSSE